MDEEAVLMYTTNARNANNFPVETTTEVTAFVREKSATRTEFYEALRSGKTVSMVFEVRIEDFNLTAHTTANGKRAYADKISYQGATYDIIRTFRNDKSMIELICS